MVVVSGHFQGLCMKFCQRWAHFCVKCYERACHSLLFFTVCFVLWCDHHTYYSARLMGKSPVLRHLGCRPWEQEFLSVDEGLLGLDVAWQACELHEGAGLWVWVTCMASPYAC